MDPDVSRFTVTYLCFCVAAGQRLKTVRRAPRGPPRPRICLNSSSTCTKPYRLKCISLFFPPSFCYYLFPGLDTYSGLSMLFILYTSFLFKYKYVPRFLYVEGFNFTAPGLSNYVFCRKNDSFVATANPKVGGILLFRSGCRCHGNCRSRSANLSIFCFTFLCYKYWFALHYFVFFVVVNDNCQKLTYKI